MTPLTLRFDAPPSGWVLLGNRDPRKSFRRRHPVGDAASLQQLRKSSITVVRHIPARMKNVGRKVVSSSSRFHSTRWVGLIWRRFAASGCKGQKPLEKII